MMAERGTTTLELAGNSEGEWREEELERAGRAILMLIQKAADTATDTATRAADQERKLASKLQTSQDRVKELEVELRNAQDRADRAERWLSRIKEEIQANFFDRAAGA